jgi:hypothetical protein
VNRLKLGPIHKIRGDSYSGRIVNSVTRVASEAEGGQIQCRLGAVSGVECRPGCRDMPLYAAICRSLERKSLIFLGLGFFFEPEGRGFESLPARQFC